MNIINDYEGIREAELQLSIVKNDLIYTSRKIIRLINQLEQTWTGEASAEYLRNLRKSLNELTSLCGVADVIKAVADERVAAMSELEQSASTDIQNSIC